MYSAKQRRYTRLRLAAARLQLARTVVIGRLRDPVTLLTAKPIAIQAIEFQQGASRWPHIRLGLGIEVSTDTPSIAMR